MTHAALAADSLSTLAAGYAARLPWRPWFTPHSRWARRVVAATDHEVWLLAWLPGQGTELHDHGGHDRPAPAAFAVARGRLSEYTVVAGPFPSLRRRDLAAGQAGEVSRRTVHALRNTGDEPAVSVHVYAPRLTEMRRYLCDETGMWLASIKRAGDDW